MLDAIKYQVSEKEEVEMCADSRSLGCNVKFVKKFGGEIHVIHMILLMFKNKKKHAIHNTVQCTSANPYLCTI